MADETTTLPDTATSTSEATTEAVVTEQPSAVDAPVVEEVADATGDETALGGKLSEETSEVEEAPAGPPEKYELALEGTTLDTTAVEEAEPVLRELGLNNEQANKLLPVAKTLVDRAGQAAIQQVIDAGAQQRKDWLDVAKADEAIGGPKWDETLHLSAKALDALGYPEGSPFRQVLTETGFGNHPEMIRAMRKIGEMIGEDGFVSPNGAPKVDVPTEQRWYGKKGE